MKYFNVLIATLIIITFSQCAKNTQSAIEGTWQLVSGKLMLPDTTIVYDDSGTSRMIKVINETHFASIRQDIPNESYMFNAGKYTYNNNTYTENLEFFSNERLIGSSLSYKVEIKSDQMIMSGPVKVTGSEKPSWTLEEVYKRIKQ